VCELFTDQPGPSLLEALVPVEEPLHGVVDEHQLEVLATLSGPVQQAPPNQRGQVCT
jgi:hypothetical protein